MYGLHLEDKERKVSAFLLQIRRLRPIIYTLNNSESQDGQEEDIHNPFLPLFHIFILNKIGIYLT